MLSMNCVLGSMLGIMNTKIMRINSFLFIFLFFFAVLGVEPEEKFLIIRGRWVYTQVCVIKLYSSCPRSIFEI
jgi:hypothetical protein